MTEKKPLRPVQADFYLVISESGAERITKRWPGTCAGERVVQMRLTYPREMFRTPVLRAEVEFDGMISEVTPQQLVADVGDVLGDAGFTVQVVPVDLDSEGADDGGL